MSVAVTALVVVLLLGAVLGSATTLVRRAERRRVNAERGFQRSLDHLSLVASCGIGTWAWRVREDAIDWDSSMFPLLDVAAGSAPRNLDQFVSLMSRADRARLKYELTALPKHSGVLDTECTLAGVNRTLRLLARRTAPDRDEAGVIGICEDITKGKEWEEQNIERARLNDFSSAIGSALTEAGTLEAALGRCASAMLEHLDVAVSRIWTISSDGTTLELRASAGLYGDMDRGPRRIPVEHFTDGLIDGRAIEDTRLSVQEWVTREGLHGFGGYPLLVDDRLVGVLTMFSRKTLSHAASTTLAIVAKQLALGIEQKKAAAVQRESAVRQAVKLEAAGQLAGGVAHDFDNLLTAIAGSAELLRHRLPPGSPERQHVDEIDDATTRANDLTRQLLAFSRNQILEPHLLDLNAAIRDSLLMLQRLLGEPIHVVTRLAPVLGRVLADAGQIHQMLLNVAVNAREAMPHGGTVTIATANVEVVDRGDGDIPVGSYVMTGVACVSPKSVGMGTSVGLVIVSDIVRQAGGYTAVDSEPGAGTRLSIYLPRVADRTNAP